MSLTRNAQISFGVSTFAILAANGATASDADNQQSLSERYEVLPEQVLVTRSHYFHTRAALPNANLQRTVAGGTAGDGKSPRPHDNDTNIGPPSYTFDSSLGYGTGDSPVFGQLGTPQFIRAFKLAA